jgi:hypothetical protein
MAWRSPRLPTKASLNHRALPPILLAALLSGCGSISSFSPSNLWPFSSGATEISRKPADATEYQCAGGNVFYVRNLDANAVWLIAPDRQIRLERAAGSTQQVYSAGKVRLEIAGEAATLLDPPGNFAGCKRPGAKP